MPTTPATPEHDQRRNRARTTPAQQRWAAARTSRELLDLHREARHRTGTGAMTARDWSCWAAIHDQLVLRRLPPGSA